MNPDEADTLLPNLENAASSRGGAYPNLKSLIKLFFMWILFTIAVGVPAGIISIGIHNNAHILKSLLNFIAYVISMLLMINYAANRVYTFKVSFNKIQLWLVPIIIIGAVALIVPLSQIASLLPMPESVRKFFEQAFTKDVFSIATLVIAAPILEEILCRGILLRGLLKNYPPYKAIIISAIFFGVLHLNPWQAVPAFFGGLFMGWLYFKTQSVIPGMIAHAVINTTAVLLMFAASKQQDLLSLMGMPYYLIPLLASVLLFTVTCFAIHKKVLIISQPVL